MLRLRVAPVLPAFTCPWPGLYYSFMDQVRDAYEALGTGDVEPLVALMHPDMEWRGRRHGLRFWRPRPS